MPSPARPVFVLPPLRLPRIAPFGFRNLRFASAVALMLATGAVLAQTIITGGAPAKPADTVQAQPAPAAGVAPPAAADATKPPEDTEPPPRQIDPALLVKAAEIAFRDVANRARAADGFNTNRSAVSRARQGAELLIGMGPEMLPASAAWQWALGVETSAQPIAFCIPGGKIIVTTGFFDRMRLTDDEYTALIAHVIAHALLGHDTAAAVADYDKRRNSTEPDPDVERAARQLAQSLLRAVVTPHYDSIEERAADAVALDMIARAGVNPTIAVDAWRKVMRAGGTDAPSFLPMHPMRADRLAEIEAQLPRVMPMYQQVITRTRPGGASGAPR
jgi:hypothetical protein